MCIEVGGCRKVAVAKPGLDLFHGDPIFQKKAGAAVPSIMEPDMPQVVLLQQNWEHAGYIVRLDQLPQAIHIHITKMLLFVGVAKVLPIFFLLRHQGL